MGKPLPRAKTVTFIYREPVYTYDKSMDAVHWTVEHESAPTEHRAMPAPVFRQSTFAAMRLIEEIDRGRQSAGHGAGVVDIRRH